MSTRSAAFSPRLYFRLLQQVKPYWPMLVLSAIVTQLAGLTEPAFAWLMSPLINVNFNHAMNGVLPGVLQPLNALLTTSRDQVSPWMIPCAIIGLFLLRGVLTFSGDYLTSWFSNQLVLDLRVQMFDRLLHMPVSYYDQQSSGALISRLTYDVNNVTLAGVSLITVVLRDTAILTGQIWLMMSIDWRLSLWILIILPFSLISLRFANRRLRYLNRLQQKGMGTLTDVIAEAIHGQRVVKIFNGHSYEANRLLQCANRLRRLSIKQTVVSAANSSLVQLLIATALAAVTYYASQRSAGGAMNAGDFVSFITAMMLLSQPVQRLIRVAETLQKGLTAAESVFSLIDEPVEPDAGCVPIGRAKGALSIQGLGFQYPGSRSMALQSIDLEIAAGEVIALVGTSGGGKTTLAHLIARFYEVQQGSIQLDGVPLNELPLTALRRNIALVSQDVLLFNDTIAANIAYGMPAVSRESLEAAAAAAQALAFIQALPHGFETMVGEHGVRLSGGQKQRLAIARALLKDAPILILDEATSALDNESERQVQVALERLMAGRTTLVIAHRLSTIERADRIAVLQQAQIVEVGSHAALLKQDGIYARLWRLQRTAT